MKKYQHNILTLVLQKDTIIRALRVAILVGIILNIINNPGLLDFSINGVNLYRVLLTFFVPFFVSLYSSVLTNRGKCIDTTPIE